MNNTQSIIVYRNPAEAAFWESGMLIPLLGGLGSFLIVMLILSAIANKASRDWRGPSGLVVGTCCVVSAAVGIFVFKTLML